MSPAIVLSLALALAAPPKRDVPPALPLSGLGLLVSAGVTGGLGLTAQVWRIGVLRRGCGDAYVYPELNVSVTSCIDESLRYLGLSTAAPLLNFAAVGLAAGGGVVRGRFSAWRRELHARPRRVALAHAGAGAGVLALGVVLYVASRLALWRDAFGARTCAEHDQLDSECVRDRWSTWLILTASGQSLAVAGAGLLAYGVSYGRAARLYRGAARLRVQPALAGGFAGLTLAGRF